MRAVNQSEPKRFRGPRRGRRGGGGPPGRERERAHTSIRNTDGHGSDERSGRPGGPCAFGRRGVKGVSGAAAGVSVDGTHSDHCLNVFMTTLRRMTTVERPWNWKVGSRPDRAGERRIRAPAPVVRPAR